MTTRSLFATGAALLMMSVSLLQAQGTTTTNVKEAAGPAKVTTESLTGELIGVEGNRLLAKMIPTGQYRLFRVPPGRQFTIDGQTRMIGDLKPGTVLTATVITTTQPVTVRTVAVLDGTVWYAQGNYVVLSFPDGEQKAYNVPASFQFMVDGKPASVNQLRKGMKVSATKIVEEPVTEIDTKTVVTGKAPK
jgi:hypothetical protein